MMYAFEEKHKNMQQSYAKQKAVCKFTLNFVDWIFANNHTKILVNNDCEYILALEFVSCRGLFIHKFIPLRD